MIWWSLRWGAFLAAIAVALIQLHALWGAGAHAPASTKAKPGAGGMAPGPEFSSELKVRASADGHFYVEAAVNGVPVRFIVDTGATSIALSPQDAGRIGLRPQPHEYTIEAATANGTVRLAPVNLREVRLGSFSAYDLEAAVNQAPMRISLLGMSFLRRLESYEVRDGELRLRW